MSPHKQTRPDMPTAVRVDSWKAPSPVESPTIERKEPTDLLTAQEAATLIGMSRKTVDRRIAARGDRRIPSWPGVRNGKEVRLVSRADVLRVWPQKQGGPDMSEPVRPRPDTGSLRRAGSSSRGSDVRTSASQAVTVREPGEVSELRALAGRVPDLEARVIAEKSRADGAEHREAEARTQVLEERRERRVATAAVLRQLQAATDPELGGGAGPVMIAGPQPAEVRSSRRFAYAMAAVSVLAVGVLGWRLISADAQLTQANDRMAEVVGEKSAADKQAAQIAGELNATRETLRDERERSEVLTRALGEKTEDLKRNETAARAAGEAFAKVLGAGR